MTDFVSHHDLMVHEFKPHTGFWAESTESAWDSLSPSLFAAPVFMLSLFLSKINIKKNLKINGGGVPGWLSQLSL